jgi:Tfp pilus assembly protein PilF
MNIFKKITFSAMALFFMVATSNAQSLEDAQKAVTAEQYQKAKSLFSNLVKIQPSPENYFYFGELYLQLGNVDSAKLAFQKGISADLKGEFSLNYVGLGTADLFAKNAVDAQANFAKATASMKKKGYLEFIYIGIAYTFEPSRDLDKAFEWFNKALVLGEKDPLLHIAMGNAYKAQKKNSEAIADYQRALTLKDNLLAVEVNIAEIWTQAFNFELAETNLKAVLAKDNNFGPAYRVLAENYYRWASAFPNKRAELLPKAKDNYSRYLDLTDRSTESQYRYLIFLLNAGDYVTLEKSATDFIASSAFKKDFILAKRFRGYAALENSHFAEAVAALSEFISAIEKDRLIPTDYLYLGKAYQSQKIDSLAIKNYVKGYELDTSNTEVLGTIAKTYFSSKNYNMASNYYEKLTKLPKNTYTDWFYLGYSNYFKYGNLLKAAVVDTAEVRKTLLKADSAFTYVAIKAKNADAYLYVARVESYLNPVSDNVKVKDAFEKYIEITTAKPTITERDKASLVEAYSFVGAFFIKTDKVKSKECFDKALALAPDNQMLKDALAALKAS